MRKFLRKISVVMAVTMAVTLLPVQAMPANADELQVQSVSDAVYGTVDEAAEYLKEQMLSREENITVRISKNAVSEPAGVVYELMNKAVEYRRGDSGQAGDALKSNRNGWGCQISTDSASYIISYNVNYLTTAQQEAQLTEAVNNALAGLNLGGKTTYEKIKSIYDYICDNVDYDHEGLGDENNKIKYTAYSALINGKSVCEGYATLFYRMCMDAGIPVRVISGTGNGGAHAWNIVEINGYYYNVDVTWDGSDSDTRHDYFLKNDADFSDHVRQDEYKTAEFYNEFPMSENSYMDYTQVDAPLKKANYNYEFTTIDGTSVNTSASGKPKVLIFFSNQCANSRATISSISSSDFSDVDIICINTLSTGDDTATKDFRTNYGDSSVDFCAYTGWSNTAMWAYANDMPGYTGNIYLPVIAYIDSDNRLQMVTNGYSGAGTIRNYVNYYCKNSSSEVKHNHVFSEKWSADVNGHWHVCVAEGCDGTLGDKAEHTAGEWIVDKEATAEAEGSRYKKCTVCGYVLNTEIIPKLEPETPDIPETPETPENPEKPSISDVSYVVDGVDYSCVFNADYYYAHHQDVANAFGKDAQALFNHFMTYGMNEGRQASEEFNVESYKFNNADLVNVFGGDTRTYYIHYIKYGKSEGRKATGSVDNGGNNNGDQGNTAAGNYVVDGVDYSAVFNADYYYAHHQDVANAFGNDTQALFNHFMTYGIYEGRQASEEFNLAVYEAYNGDLVSTFGDDTRTYYIHYIKYGKSEGRKSH